MDFLLGNLFPIKYYIFLALYINVFMASLATYTITKSPPLASLRQAWKTVLGPSSRQRLVQHAARPQNPIAWLWIWAGSLCGAHRSLSLGNHDGFAYVV
jgi:hypothetical protein